jgi:hypothetical protein
VAVDQRSARERSDSCEGTWNRNAATAFLVASEYRTQLLTVGGMKPNCDRNVTSVPRCHIGCHIDWANTEIDDVQ